jgi:hypothetical protein
MRKFLHFFGFLVLLLFLPYWVASNFSWGEVAVVLALKAFVLLASFVIVFPVRSIARLNVFLPGTISILAWCVSLLFIAAGLLAVFDAPQVLLYSILFVALACVAILRAEIAGAPADTTRGQV